jgi:hypothetical protein
MNLIATARLDPLTLDISSFQLDPDKPDTTSIQSRYGLQQQQQQLQEEKGGNHYCG